MTISVRDFYEAARETVDLEVMAGDVYLGRIIPEASMNRPGLALAGFFQYFAHKRIQVLGLAELTYLRSLGEEERHRRLKRFYEIGVPALVVTRGRKVPSEILELARAAHVPVLRSRMITMDFINGATLVLEDLSSPSTRAHGTTVDIMSMGVLIEGDPGMGKSEIALALIERGHSLVADDITVLRRDRSGVIMASAVDITRFHMEIRGLGLVHVPSLFGVASMRLRLKLDLIVRLTPLGDGAQLDRTGLSPQTREVLGVEIPLITLPVAAGRDLSLIIEVAARNQKLKQLGHDAAKELDEKLIQILTKKGSRIG